MSCYENVYLDLSSDRRVRPLHDFDVKSFLEPKNAPIDHFLEFGSTHERLAIKFKTSIVDFSHRCHRY
jgi:hypothetical protein